MNYGLPYKGSKNRIAKRLGALLPSAEVFMTFSRAAVL